MRPDLTALTADDLAALSNRGTVRRAERELADGEVTGTPEVAADGAVTAAWSDGVFCTIPGGKTPADGACSCPAVGLCRHLVRTVLAYQRLAPPAAAGAAPANTPAEVSWDPGAITDEQLKGCFKPAVLAKQRGVFAKGVVAELTRGAKPTARLTQPSAVVRFPVPDAPRYARCDCAEPPPCPHVPLAVWAFRALAPDLTHGTVSTLGAAAAVAPDLLAEVGDTLAAWAEAGLAGVTQALVDRLARLEARLKTAGLVWPADVAGDIADGYARYAAHDAAFAPDQLGRLFGELMIRRDVIQADTGAVPPVLVRGTAADAAGSLGKTRLTGLGCGVTVGRASAEVVAYLQDPDTGGVSTVSRSVADPPADSGQPPRPFPVMARHTAVGGASFREVGAGQLLTQGGRRTASLRLQIGRAAATVQPSLLKWEEVKPPVLVADFAGLAARLADRPPACVRPRRAADDFYVLAVAAVTGAGFDGPTHTVTATLGDVAGATVRLIHPYTSRGRGGVEALLARLGDRSAALRFVSGTVRRTAAGLVVAPVGCVFDGPAGRVLVQPSTDDPPPGGPPPDAPRDDVEPPLSAVAEALGKLAEGWEEVLTVGLRRADADAARRWRDRQAQAESVGLTRFGGLAGALAGHLEAKARAPRWDARPAADAALALAGLLTLAADVGVDG